MTGISRIEIELPTGRMRIEEMASRAGVAPEVLLAKTGVEEKPVLAPGEDILALAVRAARRAIEAEGLYPEEIHTVIFGTTALREKLFYSPAAKIQKELGIRQAFAFDLGNGCNSANLALALAAQWLESGKHGSTVLVVIADAMSDRVDYADPVHQCIFNFADAASAAIVRRGETRNRLLAFHGATDARFADSMFLAEDSPRLWMNDDAEEDRAIVAQYRAEYPRVIRAALKQAGLETMAIDHVFINQGDHKLLPRLAEALGLPRSKLFASHRRYGHLGGTDILFGMKQRLDEGSVKPGDILVLASSAIGFSWGASIVQA